MGEKEGGGVTPAGQAAKMARQIGDEEWKQGNTKYAFEAYEASNITVEELYILAMKLRGAEVFANEWWTQLKGLFIKGGERSSKLIYETAIAVWEEAVPLLAEILAWDVKSLPRDEDMRLPADRKLATPQFYRSARVACLKLIKRMR